MSTQPANAGWNSVVNMTDAMRRCAEAQQWDEVVRLAGERQTQLEACFAGMQLASVEQRDALIRNVQALQEADRLLIEAASQVRSAVAEGLAQLQQGRKAIKSYQGCSF